MRKLKEVNGKPQRRLFETSYLNTTPISTYYCVQFIPGVYFLLSTFREQISILNSAVTRRRRADLCVFPLAEKGRLHKSVFIYTPALCTPSSPPT